MYIFPHFCSYMHLESVGMYIRYKINGSEIHYVLQILLSTFPEFFTRMKLALLTQCFALKRHIQAKIINMAFQYDDMMYTWP